MIRPVTKPVRLYFKRAAYSVSFLIAVAYLLVTVSRYLNRPPFCNTFAIHPDRGLLPQWWPFPFPIVDRAGNLVLLDEKLNLLVIVPTGDPQYQGQRMPEESADGSYIDLTVEPPRRVRLPTPSNRMVILDVTGQIAFEADLSSSEGSTLFDQIDDHTSDAATLLMTKVKQN